jgi:hypothetical protein
MRILAFGATPTEVFTDSIEDTELTLSRRLAASPPPLLIASTAPSPA